MGATVSAPAAGSGAPARVAARCPYFGAVGALGSFDDEQIEAQIHSLQRAHFRVASQRRLSGGARDAVRPARLRCFAAVGAPAPHLRLSGGACALAFGLRAELPGRMALIADGQIASAAFAAGAAGLRALPLPALADFTVELAPLMDGAAGLTPAGFAPVERQSLRFRVVGARAGAPQLLLAEERLRCAAAVYSAERNRGLRVESAPPGVCLFCAAADAVGPPCACARACCCAECMEQRAARCARCPFCFAPF